MVFVDFEKKINNIYKSHNTDFQEALKSVTGYIYTYI